MRPVNTLIRCAGADADADAEIEAACSRRAQDEGGKYINGVNRKKVERERKIT
jgi:hypothetical protein